MKVLKLTIHHVGLVTDQIIKLEKPLLLFYGDIRQGKTTILNAVRWVCGGEFPEDIIQHGKDEAFIELELEDGMISRSWYRAKDEAKTVKARPVTFIRNGKPVASPVGEIKRFLNPFLLNQDHLRNMSELERKKYFAELFAVDTSELDGEWVQNDREASNLRMKVKGYGDIDLTEHKAVDVTALHSELQAAKSKHQAEVQRIRETNMGITDHNSLHDRSREKQGDLKSDIEALKQQLADKEETLSNLVKWCEKNPLKAKLHDAAPPDTEELEKKIQDAGATNVRAEQFAANQKRAEAKKVDEKAIADLETRQRAIKKQKQAKLKTISDTCGIKDLAFDDEGNFTYQGCQAGMLSTSQIMQLSSELSAMYPEGLGVELWDRGESLGKSIFAFVDRAKEEKKTILATIVGERPAKVPQDIGVFVVSNGSAQEAPEEEA